MDIRTLENWLWEAASSIRGRIDPAKYKDYILPLIFIKRMSDVFEDELKKLAKDLGSIEEAENLLKKDHSYVTFYIPKGVRWEDIVKKSDNIGQFLTDCAREIVKHNPKLEGVIDNVDFNATASGERIISDDSLKRLINILNRHRLGLNDVEPDILGRAYEYLLKKFAEGAGQSAGEFYTPKEVAIMMAKIVDPEPGNEIYDPCAGSGGLLIKCYLVFKEKYKDYKKEDPLKFYGQEVNHSTYAIAKMNVFIYDMEADIRIGDTMRNPKFLENGSLKKFDIVVANPMWNQSFPLQTYEGDLYGRFVYGYPPTASADWGWIQHMFASLKENGRMAVVLDTGAVSRGSNSEGKNKERDIRKAFVDNDLIEAIILLPENLFYNTTAPGVIIVINKNKPQNRKDKIMMINISEDFEKGRPKNFLSEETIEKVVNIYKNWQEVEGVSKIITKDEAIRNDYNLSPSRYIAKNGEDEILPLEEAIIQLKEAEEERQEAEKILIKILNDLNISLKI